jgi:uncharacterized protein
MANSVVHFEIPANDVERAKAFYQKTFGWKIKPFPMPPGHEYFGVTTRKKGEPGIDGGLMKRQNPGQAFTNYIAVRSIDAMNELVLANGGTVVLPKQAIGQNMGWISVFKDPEENLIGLFQSAPPPPKKRAVKRVVKKAKAGKKAKKTTRSRRR